MTERTVTMPLVLTSEMIRAVRDDPTTIIADRDAWHARVGWLLCAWDVLVQHRRPPRKIPLGLAKRALECCAAGETLANSEFKARIDADGHGTVIAANLNTTLHRLARDGRLTLVGHGNYRKAGQASTLDAGTTKAPAC